MNDTAKIILGLIVAILIIWGGYSIYNKQTTEPTASEPIKIGATLALTGNLSYKGQPGLKGMKLAIEEINSEGGINGKELILVSEDNQGSPSDAVTTVQKLINIDGVNIILSAFTHISSAIAPVVINSNKVLIYESTVGSIAKNSDNVFKDYYSMEDVGKKFVISAKKEKVTKLGVLYPVSEWGEDFKKGIELKANEFNIEIVDQPFAFGATDLKTEMLKIKSKGVNGITATGFSGHMHDILKNVYRQNLDVKLFMVEIMNDDIKQDLEAMEAINKTNAISSWYHFTLDSSDNLTQDFIKNYKEKYGEEPRADAAYFYDDIKLIAKVLRECDLGGKVDDTECIIASLKEVKKFEGVAGEINFDDDGICNRPIKLFKYTQNSWNPYFLE